MGPFRLLTWRRSRLAALLALFALTLQALVVQTHVDFAGVQTSVAAQTQISAPSENGSAVCVICQEMVLAGAATLPGAPALAPIVEAVLDATPARAAASARQFPAHPWHSRGPPAI